MSYVLIRRAILEKKIVRAIYHGLFREMCPHVLGTTNGKECALFYQFEGQSVSAHIQPGRSKDNWRCIDISELSDVTIEDGAWHSAPDGSRPIGCVVQIDVAISS